MECQHHSAPLTTKRSYEEVVSVFSNRSVRHFEGPKMMIYSDHMHSEHQHSDPYAEDIHRLHCVNEEQQWLRRKRLYPEGTEVNQQSRAIVIDWLIEVSHDYSLSLETLFLAVNYFDRMIEEVSVKKDVLQLLAITCLFIASKYEEVKPLTLDQLVNAELYSRRNIIDMERIVLKNLKFKLVMSTLRNFLSRYIMAIPDPLPLHFTSHTDFLSEMILSADNLYCTYPPSQLAAAIVTVSCIAFHITPQIPVDNYSLSELRPVIRSICMLYGHIITIPVDKPFTATREKYKAVEYGCVSDVTLPQGLLDE